MRKRGSVPPREEMPITYGNVFPVVEEAVDNVDPDYIPPIYGGLPKVTESVEDLETIEECAQRMLQSDLKRASEAAERERQKQNAILKAKRDAATLRRISRVKATTPDPYALMIIHFNDLTQEQYRIFEYIIQHPGAAGSSTQLQIAKASNSTAEAVRNYAKTLGYSDYMDLRYALSVYAEDYAKPKAFNTALDSIEPNLLIFESILNRKVSISILDRIRKMDHVYLMGRDISTCSARQMEYLLNHANFSARYIDLGELERSYPSFTKHDLVIYYYNPIDTPPADSYQLLEAAHTRCNLAFVSSSIPHSYFAHIDHYLHVSPYCPVDFLVDGPLLYFAANGWLIKQLTADRPTGARS